MRLSEEDHALVSAAIAEAERASDGEIVAVVTDCSDSYHDVALHWALFAMIAVLAAAAAFPTCLESLFGLVLGGWRAEPTLRETLTLLLVVSLLAFILTWLLLRIPELRMALTPGATRSRRVRRRAIQTFKAGAERRTIGRTGILIYLSMREHRAEIIGDEAITKVTTPETWGEAMAALLVEVKAGRLAAGIVAAVRIVGGVLAEHFPRSAEDTNEIPDKLIEL